MTFDDVAIAADQEFELTPNQTGTAEYSTKYVYRYAFISNYSCFHILCLLQGCDIFFCAPFVYTLSVEFRG